MDWRLAPIYRGSTGYWPGLAQVWLGDIFVNLGVLPCLQLPSISAITTLRIAQFIQGAWADGWSVCVTATDGLGGAFSALIYLTNDTPLKATWEALALVFQHLVTTVELVDPHLIMLSATAIHMLVDVLPGLHTIKAQLPPIPRGFEALREILARKHGSARLERLVVGTESPDEARRNGEEWKALCAKHKVHEFSV